MFVRLKHLLFPPVFPDEEQTRTAALLNTALLVACGIIVLYILTQLATADVTGLLVGMLFALPVVVLWWWLRRGAVQFVSVLLCGIAFAGLTLFAYELGGVGSSSYSLLILAVVIAAVFLGGRVALVVAALSVVMGWLLMQPGVFNLIPRLTFFTPFDAWLGQSLVFCVAALLLGLADRSLRQALAAARNSQAALQQRTQELERERSASRASEERYRNFIEQSMEGIWLLEFDQPIPIDLPPREQVDLIQRTGYIAECNAAFAKMYGYERQAMRGKRLLDLHGGRVTEANVAAALRLVQSDYRSANRETVEVNRQGETIHFLNNAVGSVRDGQLIAIWGTQRDVTDRKLIEHMLDRRARQLQTAAEVSRAVASILDLSALLPRVVELLKDGFDLYYAGLFLIDASGRRAALRAGTGEAGQQLLHAGHQLPIDDQSMVGWCILHRQPRLALDVGEDPVHFDNPRLPATRSEIALPLIKWGQSIGAITIQSDRPRAFTQDDADVLQTMADQVAIAINNAELFEAEKRHTALMTALRDIGLDLSMQLEVSALLKTIVTRAAQLSGAPMGDLLLLEPDGQTLKEVANYQSPPSDQVFTLQIGEGVSGRVALTGKPLIIDDYAAWPDRIRAIDAAGYRSVLGVPIQWQGRVLGVINLQDKRPAVFTLEHANRLQLFAAQAAVALENVRLFEATRQNLAELKLVHAVAVAAASADEEDALIQQAMQAVGEALAPDFFGVLLTDEALGALRLNIYHAGVGIFKRPQTIPLGTGITGRVAVTGQSLRTDDVQREAAYYQVNPETRSELCVPLKVGERVLGVINMESRRLAAFSAADEQLLATVAGQLATAIDRLRVEAARRRNEEELAQERNLLRTLIDNLPDAHVFVKDIDSHFITTSAAHLQTLGVAALEDVIGKTDFDFFPREGAEQYFADEQAVIQSGRPLLNREEQVIDRAGRLRWYLTHKVPLLDRQGTVIGLVGMSLDITARKQMEERERAIARGLQAVLEAADELLPIDDLDLFYRRAVELPREKLAVERCGIFLLEPDQQFLRGMYGTDLHGHTTDERAVKIPATHLPELSTRGPRRRILPAARYSYWDHGAYHEAGAGWVAMTVIGSSDEVIGVLSNDTALSQAPLDEVQQEALAVYCSLLGNIILRKRSAQERERLINELEAKNAELERFTYTVSHDLKSPLITIRGFMGFLERDAREGNFDRLHADLARITQATDKMQRLLDELLELSRIGRLTNAPEQASFESIAREAVSLVEGRLTARGVQVNLAPDLPDVFVDYARLVEVMQNLIDNAVKFMGDQVEPCIEIGVRNEDNRRVFFVRDNGAGIDPRYHDKVFGLFDKLDPRSDGTGIGLALVKRIIEVHGGRIWVESAGLGHGSTFCFTLST